MSGSFFCHDLQCRIDRDDSLGVADSLNAAADRIDATPGLCSSHRALGQNFRQLAARRLAEHRAALTGSCPLLRALALRAQRLADHRAALTRQ